MDAELRELMGQTYGKAPIVTSTPPIFPSAPLVSTDLKESGLWLWQGDAPPPPALARPKSRDQRFLRRIMPAAGWAGWIALPTGLTLMLIAISMIRHPDSPVSADTPPVAPSSAPSRTAAISSPPSPTLALPSAPSPTAARPIVAVPPATLTEAQMDQVQVPSAPPPAQVTAQVPEQPVVKGRAQHKLWRNARKTQALHVRKRPLFPTPGVLTPPSMTWHGGGY
jgi:hypothetical protein